MPERQCAWCWRVFDVEAGQYRAQAERKIKTASHGICPSCKAEMRAEIDASLPLAA
jgi:hypothetical protein